MCAPRAKRVVAPAAVRPTALQLLAPRAAPRRHRRVRGGTRPSSCLPGAIAGGAGRAARARAPASAAPTAIRRAGPPLRSRVPCRGSLGILGRLYMVIGERHPRILAWLLPGLADPHGALGPPCTRAAAHAEATLRAAGFTAPPWAALVDAAQASHVFTSGTLRVDGSKPRAPAWTSVPSRRYFPTSIRRLGHCCCLKRGRAAVLFSPPCQRAKSLPCRTT